MKTRTTLYLGIVYNIICTFITSQVIVETSMFNDFGKYLLLFGLAISIWHTILLLMYINNK